MHLIEEAFGESCDLYKDVLKCPRDADAARLRKAYYRRALQYHPDKQQQQGSSAERSQLLFQGISLAYQLLKDPETRAVYDETGEIPDTNDDDTEKPGAGASQWKAYFDQIFGQVTTSDIDAFAAKYKCSDEERRDVIKEFRARKGNLHKMLEFVMLSQPHDCLRWVEDYLRPAFDNELADIQSSYEPTLEKTLKQIQAKLDKAKQTQSNNGSNDNNKEDNDATDTEESDDDDEEEAALPAVLRDPTKTKTKNVTAKKAKPTQTKKRSIKSKKKKNNDMSDLIAQIQNKQSRGGAGANLLASLGNRYGVTDMEDDPMNDEEFSKARARVQKKKKSSR